MEKFTSTKKFRFLQWEEDTNRMDIDGVFTAQDLRNIANWLDDPDHPIMSPDLPVVVVKLSPICPK